MRQWHPRLLKSIPGIVKMKGGRRSFPKKLEKQIGARSGRISETSLSSKTETQNQESQRSPALLGAVGLEKSDHRTTQ